MFEARREANRHGSQHPLPCCALLGLLRSSPGIERQITRRSSAENRILCIREHSTLSSVHHGKLPRISCHFSSNLLTFAVGLDALWQAISDYRYQAGSTLTTR